MTITKMLNEAVRIAITSNTYQLHSNYTAIKNIAIISTCVQMHCVINIQDYNVTGIHIYRYIYTTVAVEFLNHKMWFNFM